MPNETKIADPKIEPKPAEKPKVPPFTARRLKVVTGSSRGNYLADADTGEDLRLPIMSMSVHPSSIQANVHCTFLVVKVEPEKR